MTALALITLVPAGAYVVHTLVVFMRTASLRRPANA
jgi:hypothetical protein